MNAIESASVPKTFLAKLVEMHADLKSSDVLAQLSKIVALEESVYRTVHRNNYFASRLAIDGLPAVRASDEVDGFE